MGNNLTYQLLQVIGSPFLESNKKGNKNNFNELYFYAKKNKMPLLYLRSISDSSVKDESYENYITLNDKWVEIENSIRKVIKILDDNKVKYATFKSIKPYREVTVDIDLLIYGSYALALRRLNDSGFKMLGKGPLSSTFRDPNFRIDYDIYNEVGVSHIIYFDKDKALNFIEKKDLQTGGYIESFVPSIDLLAVIAHSVIKEQLYTIAEYYTTLYYLHSMDEDDLKTFIDMVDHFKLRSAVRSHLSVTYSLHRMVHGVVPKPLRDIVTTFGLDEFEVERIRRSGYKVPHKFHSLTLLRSFQEKLQEPKARRSLALQARSMTSPDFFASFFPQFLSHIVRETY
jgi:hypothetical protein